MSLVEYCAYLKREIFSLRAEVCKLRADLADALARQKMYEPLLETVKPEPPPPPKSYWQWFRFR